MAEYQIDWDKHNNRDKGQIRADIMTQCFHSGVDNIQTARILFAAGHSVKADIVAKFFAGRQKWLDSKKETKAPVSQASLQEEQRAATEDPNFDDDIPF